MSNPKLQVVLNAQDLARGLARRLMLRYLKNLKITWTHTTAYLDDCKRRRRKTGLIEVNFRQVNDCLNRDVNEWYDQIITSYKRRYRKLENWIAARISTCGIGMQDWMRMAINDADPVFVINVAGKISADRQYITQWHDIDPKQDLIVRNILNNEDILSNRMRHQRPFWFIDSGYTNFLGRHKTWHRLVRNGVHVVPDLDRPWPADRLRYFTTWPREWNHGGESILVVENSESHYCMFGFDNIQTWRDRIRKSLSKITDKEIIFRPKQGTRKDRENVYTMLNRDPRRWYCVISDCSSAAIEAIWCGIPVITMRVHITNPVARMSLNNINDLYRGNLGNWLCALSYSQFTVDELESGYGVNITRKWYA